MYRYGLLWLASLVAQADTTLIHVGKWLDVTQGKMVEAASITVRDGKFVAIEKGWKAAASGESLIDLKRYTVLPGMMDMHVHFSGEMSPTSYSERFFMNPPDVVLRSTTYARKTLDAGFTTVRDLGANNGISISLRNAIDKGWIVGPRMFVAGKSIGTTGGHADPSNGLNDQLRGDPGPDEGVINGADDARKAVRQRYKEGADLIKLTATGGVLSLAKNGQNPQFFDDELKAVVATANDYGFTVAVHAHGKEGMLRAVRAGVTSIEHGTFMDEEVMREMKVRGTWYVPTLSAGVFVAEKAKIDGFFPDIVRPKAVQIGAQIRDTFAKAQKYGLKIAMGTDAGVSAHGDNAREFVLMVEGGMSAMAAIQAGTINAAELLRKKSELGSISVGKFADLIAVENDPVQDIRELSNISFVMKQGVVYKTP